MKDPHFCRPLRRTSLAFNFAFLAVAFISSASAVLAQTPTPDAEAKPLLIADAVYPSLAKDAFVSGNVDVRVNVDGNGRATDAVVVRGPGSVCSGVTTPAVSALKEAAVAAARNASFSPTPSIQIVTVEFKAAENAPRPRMISGGVLNGKAASLPTPAYPPAAKAVGASGDVNVQIVIGEDGTVYSAAAVSGHPLLRQASVQAACSATFSPTLLSGVPVRISGIVVYNFAP